MKKLLSIFITLSLFMSPLLNACCSFAVKNLMAKNITKIDFHFGYKDWLVKYNYSAAVQGPITPNQVLGWHWDNIKQNCKSWVWGICQGWDNHYSSIYQIDVYVEGQEKPITTTGSWANDWDFLIDAQGNAIGIRQYDESYDKVLYTHPTLWPAYLQGFGGV